MKRGALSVLGIGMILALSACGDANSIVGSWKVSDIDKNNNECEDAFIFHDDGTYEMKLSNDKKVYHGKYKETDNDKHLYKLKVDDPYVVKMKRNEDSLTISYKDGSKSCTFDKK